MNKKLVLVATSAVIVGIIVLFTLLRSIGQTHEIAGSIIAGVLSVLAFPIRLYVFFVRGDNGSWSIPVLIFFLVSSGLIWGVIIERIAAAVKRERQF